MKLIYFRPYLACQFSLVCFLLILMLAHSASQSFATDSDRTGSVVKPPSYGEPFTLVDHTGHIVTDKTYRGRYMLIFFGYVFCPDICPTGHQTMSHALDLLGEAAKHVQPVFISIDPKRDTPQVLDDYVGNFDPSLVGLTGTPRQVHEAAYAYRVRYGRDEYNGEILVDHTAYTYFVGPDGQYITDFGHGTEPKAMAEAILKP